MQDKKVIKIEFPKGTSVSDAISWVEKNIPGVRSSEIQSPFLRSYLVTMNPPTIEIQDINN